MSIGPSNQNPANAPEPHAQGTSKPTTKQAEHLPTPKPSREPSEIDLPDEAGALIIDPAILAQELALMQQSEIAQQEATQHSPSIQASSSSVEEPVKRNRDRPLKRKASSSPSHRRPVKVQHVPTTAQQEWQCWHDSQSHKTPLQLQSQPASPTHAAQAAVPVAPNSLHGSNGFPPGSASPADNKYARDDELPDVEPGQGSYTPDWEEQIPGSRTNGLASDKGTPGPVSQNGDPVQFHPALFLADDPVKDQQVASTSLPSAPPRPIAPKPPHVPELKAPPRHPTVEKLRQEAMQSSKKHSPNGNFALLNSQPTHGSLAMRVLPNNRESQDPSFTIGPKPSQEASKSSVDSDSSVSPKSRKRQRTPSLKARENEDVVHTLISPAHEVEQAMLSAVKRQTTSTVKSPKGRKDGSVIATSTASPSHVRMKNQKQTAKDPKETGSKVPANMKIRLSTKNKGRGRADISTQETSLTTLPSNLVPRSSFPPYLGPDEYGVFPEAEISPDTDVNQVENEISHVPAAVPLQTLPRPRSNSLSSRGGRNLSPQIPAQDLPEKVRRWHGLGLETFQDLSEDGSIEHRVVTRTRKSDNSVEWWLNQLLLAVVNEHPNEDTPEDILRLMRWKADSTVPRMLRRKVQEWGLQLAPGPVVSLVPTDRLVIRSYVVVLALVSDKAESKAKYGEAALKVFGDHTKMMQKTGWDELLESVEAKARTMKHGRLWRKAGLGPDKVRYKEDQALWAFREWEERLRGRGQFVEDWKAGFIASRVTVTADTANSQDESHLSRVIPLGYRREKQTDELSWMAKAEADKVLLPGEQVRYRPVQVEFRAGEKTQMRLEYARLPRSRLALQRGHSG